MKDFYCSISTCVHLPPTVPPYTPSSCAVSTWRNCESVNNEENPGNPEAGQEDYLQHVSQKEIRTLIY